jgi:hypothetical protein
MGASGRKRGGVQVPDFSDGHRRRHLILLDLTGDGSLQYLYPKNGAAPYLDQDEYPLRMRISPPFGADKLIAIASKQRLAGLELAVSRLARGGDSTRLPAQLDQYLSDDGGLGIATFSPRPRAAAGTAATP